MARSPTPAIESGAMPAPSSATVSTTPPSPRTVTVMICADA